jgi:hypothetical protein
MYMPSALLVSRVAVAAGRMVCMHTFVPCASHHHQMLFTDSMSLAAVGVPQNEALTPSAPKGLAITGVGAMV